MSLSIGDHIFRKLTESSELRNLVGDKIYPLSTVSETTFPFIVYRRGDIVARYTKDHYIGDSVKVEIAIMAEGYTQSVTIAEAVRRAIDCSVGVYDGFDVIDARMFKAEEDFIDETFVQLVIFELTTQIN